MFRKALTFGATIATVGGAAMTFALTSTELPQTYADTISHLNMSHVPYVVPSREDQLKALQQSDREYDVLVVGGGATGVGVALDAATRGLDVALVERDDFSSGTSSRSTKLIHGGVRYLQKAVMQLDYEQYKMVREALHERANLLKIAPHLTIHLPIMLPIYQWWNVPYFWAGCKLYDLVAGNKALESSYFLGSGKALEKFPMLKKEKLVGAMVYYDGQHNDSRMNVALALTAAANGAVVANHVSVIELLKTNDPNTGKKICSGAILRDELTGETWKVKAKCVVNATGPFADELRMMDDQTTKKIVQPSSGVHVILPDYYSPESMGLIDPSTSDGRVIFFLPWQNSTIAGTTDTPCEVDANPKPTEEEIDWILEEITRYLSKDVQVRRGDVLAAWSGIRPLVFDPNKKNTESLARNHIVHVSDSNLVTICGGKWTTYRSMAIDTMEAAIQACDLKPKGPSLTETTLVIGAHDYSPTMYLTLIQKYGLDKQVAKHLATTYGDKAHDVLMYATPTNKRWPVIGNRLVDSQPYIEAEVIYAAKHEYACTAVDMLARRFRLAFLNVHQAFEALPKVVELMAKELNWSQERQKKEIEHAKAFLLTMGLENQPTPDFNAQQLIHLRDDFYSLDEKHEGVIKKQQLLDYIQEQMKPEHPKSKTIINDFVKAIDQSQNGAVYFKDFLEIISRLQKTGATPKTLVKNAQLKKKISTTRSGGGV